MSESWDELEAAVVAAAYSHDIWSLGERKMSPKMAAAIMALRAMSRPAAPRFRVESHQLSYAVIDAHGGLKEGREIARCWRQHDAEAIAEALNGKSR